MGVSSVTATIDYDALGKHTGFLQIPQSTNSAAWGALWVSIASIRNGSGPTVLILGGNHGDEYEGQIAALNLVREVDARDVAGHLIVIPCLSVEASRAGTRLWPSGANFNRCFPGDPDGEPADQLADYLTTELFARADVVIDMHSGGRSMYFAPMSHMHVVADRAQRHAMVEGMLAWNTDLHLLYTDVAGAGLLPSEAERQGKVVITTELGGAGFASRSTLDIARNGLLNVLRKVGVLAGEPVNRTDLGLAPATILDATSATDYVRVHDHGLFEPLVVPGSRVEPGTTLGRLHFPARPDRPSEHVEAPKFGVVAAICAFPWVDQGTCVAVVGHPVEVADILEPAESDRRSRRPDQLGHDVAPSAGQQ